MLNHADSAAVLPQAGAASEGQSLAAGRMSEALLLPSTRTGCGTSLPVSVGKVLAGDAGEFLSTLQRLCNAGVPVCIQPRELGKRGEAIGRWQAFCEILRRVLCVDARLRARPAICIAAHALPLQAYCVIADALLGRGPRFVYLDSLQMDLHCASQVRERALADWTFLWRQRHSARPVLPVYGGFVKSACPLLSSEAATALLPEGGMLVPAGSHWLPLTLRLDKLANADGAIEPQALDDILGIAIERADALLESYAPPCQLQRRDLQQNRRIALLLTGFGELIMKSGRNPADLSSLQCLQQLVARIRACLHDNSRALALSRGMVPALAEADFGASFSDTAWRDNWQRQWRLAVARSAIRHRNLLVMSPYSVLPESMPAGPRFADLLPLIAAADAWSFSSSAAQTHWNVNQFSQFHRRARAVIQGSHKASFIAAGV